MRSDCPADKPMKKVEIKEETKAIDVSDGLPQHVTVHKPTILILKGAKSDPPEKVFNLNAGTYVVGEVIKNIFVNESGKYKKIGTKHFLVVDKVGF